MRASILLALAASLLSLSSVDALEKRPVLDDVELPGGNWARCCTCTIIYYNRCTLWSWVWGDFEPGDRIGVHYITRDCVSETWFGVGSTYFRVFTGSPAGYGFTGTISIVTADAQGCPTGTTLASHAFLPTAPYSVVQWDNAVVPSGPPGWIMLWTNGLAVGNPASFGTDHPAAGATGPAACGFCFPVDRPVHSFRYGTATTPICPGAEFDDGTCAAELRWVLFGGILDWYAPVSVESDSWGGIKAMYR